MTEPKITSSTLHSSNVDPGMMNNYFYDSRDEISLTDVWLALVKQKHIFLIVFFVISGLGLIYSLTRPAIYDYTTTINIGRQLDNETLIQPVETVKSELSSAYIDKALHEYYLSTNNNINTVELTVDSPKNTSLIILKSLGTLDESDAHLTIHQNILQRLVEKHSATTLSIIDALTREKLKLSYEIEDLASDNLFKSKQLQTEKVVQENREQLNKLQELKTNLELALTRLQSLRDLLQSQYKNDLENLKTANQNLQSASKADNVDTALLVLLTSELQQYRTRIASLEERLNITLPAQEIEIKQQISDNARNQKDQKLVLEQSELALTKLSIDRQRDIDKLKSQLSKIENDIKSLSVTHAIVEPSRSFKPTNSKKKKLIILISVVTALFMGLFAALFASFLANIKQEK